MKLIYQTSFLILLFCFSFSNAQQNEYTAYLEQALEAAINSNEKAFNTNLVYFSTAIEKDNITPQSLTEKNYNLYTKALFKALSTADFEVSEELSKKALKFINYDIENRPENMFSLGRLYGSGKGVPLDYTLSKKWYEKAANAGNDMAMNNLGVAYFDGTGVPQDYLQAKYWFEKALDANPENHTAMGNMGVLYLNGLGVNKDIDFALDWFKRSSELGNTDSMKTLGDLYKNGEKVAKNIDLAIHWYKKAIEKGSDSAMNGLGVLYAEQNDYTKAIEWYKKAGEKDNPWALNNLGELYYRGNGVEKDYKEAKKWYEKGDKAGSIDATYSLAYLYDEGFGADFDWNQARILYNKAADKDHIASTRKLGEFYYFGVGGVDKDISKAMSLFKKAADAGDEKALIYLEIIIEINNGNIGAFHRVNQSNYGNDLYMPESKTSEKNQMPWTISKHGASWGMDIYFTNNSGGGVQIFPIQEFPDERPLDAFVFSNYSPSSPMYESEGKHNVFVRQSKEWGSRGIGYLYITGYFSNEELMIKVPMAVCWKPQNEY